MSKEIEDEKSEAVKGCTSFAELEEVIKKHAPFISKSRPNPIEWTAEQLIERIGQVLEGSPSNIITRANGLRAKVNELAFITAIEEKSPEGLQFEDEADIKEEADEKTGEIMEKLSDQHEKVDMDVIKDMMENTRQYYDVEKIFSMYPQLTENEKMQVRQFAAGRESDIPAIHIAGMSNLAKVLGNDRANELKNTNKVYETDNGIMIPKADLSNDELDSLRKNITVFDCNIAVTETGHEKAEEYNYGTVYIPNEISEENKHLGGDKGIPNVVWRGIYPFNDEKSEALLESLEKVLPLERIKQLWNEGILYKNKNEDESHTFYIDMTRLSMYEKGIISNVEGLVKNAQVINVGVFLDPLKILGDARIEELKQLGGAKMQKGKNGEYLAINQSFLTQEEIDKIVSSEKGDVMDRLQMAHDVKNGILVDKTKLMGQAKVGYEELVTIITLDRLEELEREGHLVFNDDLTELILLVTALTDEEGRKFDEMSKKELWKEAKEVSTGNYRQSRRH